MSADSVSTTSLCAVCALPEADVDAWKVGERRCKGKGKGRGEGRAGTRQVGGARQTGAARGAVRASWHQEKGKKVCVLFE